MNGLNYRISNHAREEMARRRIAAAVVRSVMSTPQQILKTRENRRIYQAKITIDGKLYLVRVIVEMSDPLTVVTVYRTSKIDKYWSENDESNV